MAKSKSLQKQYNPARPNLWGMIRDIAIISINKGQFPLAVVAAIMIIVLLKIPSEDLSKLAFRVLEKFELANWGGWVLSLILVFLWYFTSKTLRKNYFKELDRIIKENEELQQLLLAEKAI